jgi:catechol 2,3-dioxygenase-like lactoylglutathione lyase family enzyme
MRTTRGVNLSHVSIGARDVDSSAVFYIDLFGAEHVERLPTPNLGGPIRVVWLRLGDLQIHLAEREAPPRAHKDHFGVGVVDRDLFQSVFRKAHARGFLEADAYGHYLYRLPGGEAQLYVRDPHGNVVEVDYPVATELDPDIRAHMHEMSERFPQPPEAWRSSLFTAPERWHGGVRADGTPSSA